MLITLPVKFNLLFKGSTTIKAWFLSLPRASKPSFASNLICEIRTLRKDWTKTSNVVLTELAHIQLGAMS